MDFLINLVNKVDMALSTSVILILIVLFFWFIGFLIKHRKDVMCIINQWFKHKQEKDKLLKMVYENKQMIDEYAENRIHDREQSFKIQKQLTDAINTVSDKLDAMNVKQAELEEKHNKRVRAEMKDKISQLYRYYHEKQEWNDMEKEALNDLIRSYEDAGGENYFIHSAVEVERYSWKVVEKS